MEIIKRFNESNKKIAMIIAGGGLSIPYEIWKQPKCSETLIFADIVYDYKIVQNYVDNFCHNISEIPIVSEQFAIILATACKRKASVFSKEPFITLSVTAAMPTVTRERNGENRAFMCIIDENGTAKTKKICIEKNEDRIEAEKLILKEFTNLLKEYTNLDCYTLRNYYFKQNNDKFLIVYPDGQTVLKNKWDLDIKPKFFCGSFNPLHEGHTTILNSFSNVFVEISIYNFQKDKIEYEDLVKRVSQFRWKYPIVITKAPKYNDKAKLFDGIEKPIDFIVGEDVFCKVIHCNENVPNVNFIVVPRKTDNKKELKLSKQMPKINYTKVNIDVPKISSTEIRSIEKSS